MLRFAVAQSDAHAISDARTMQSTRLLAVCLVFAATIAAADQRPNIILIMGDDHAQWAVGAYGATAIETPNIDWLSAHGVKFDNAFSPAPVCSPARASFYTGKMPSQHGVHDFLAESAEFDADWLDGERLLSEKLRALGYRTGLFGKWHATTDSKPPQPGFDRWLSYDPLHAGWQDQYQHSGTVTFSSDGERVTHTGVQARFLAEQATRFFADPATRPFFVSLNFVEPHAPFSGLPERLVARYRDVAATWIRAGGNSALSERSGTTVPDDHVEQLAQYLAAVTLIDEQVGRVIDALHGNGLLDNTLIIYTSDHGLLMGQYGVYGKANATDPANFYEATIRIPLIVHGPASWVRGQQTRSEFVDLIDLQATILDIAGANPAEQAGDGPGRSMRPLLLGDRLRDWRRLQYAERGRARMVSDGRWKLVRYYNRDTTTAPRDDWYDLAHPLAEQQSVAPPRAAVRDRLSAELDAFFRRYETEKFSGRHIWNQPPANARMQSDLDLN